MLTEKSYYQDDYSIDLRNIVAAPFSTFSILGCFYIFISFFANKDIRTKTLYKLVFHLSFVDFLRTLAGLYVPASVLENQQNFICTFEAYMVWFTNLCSLLLATAFSIKIYNMVVRDKSVEKCTDLTKTFILCYGISFLLTTIFLIISLNKTEPIFGYDKCFCLIDNSRKENIAYLGISFYGPYIILAIYNLSMYWRTSSYIKKFDPSAKKPLKFMLYPLLLFLGAIPALVGWICQLFEVNHNLNYIYYLNVGAAQCIGLWNFFVFILTTNSKQGFCLNIKQCCYPSVNEEQKDLEDALV